MTAHQLIIAAQIFAYFPEYRRGVVVAEHVKNISSPAELVGLIHDEETRVRRLYSGKDPATLPEVVCWREAYRQADIKPTKFRPSFEGLFRRVLQGQDLPLINALVDIGNLVSLRHLVPVGGHAIDLLRGDMMLSLATGSEVFVPFGSEIPENPDLGEIVFTDGDVVLTRRWTWRQAQHTLTTLTTTQIEYNVDGLPPITTATLHAICKELGDLVLHFCGGEARSEIVSKEKPAMKLAVQDRVS